MIIVLLGLMLKKLPLILQKMRLKKQHTVEEKQQDQIKSMSQLDILNGKILSDR